LTNPTFITTASDSEPNALEAYNYTTPQNEFTSEFEWYDYGARFYDPSLGRFFVQDRFTEKYLDFTPYQYAANNPLKYIDINGDSIAVNVIAGGGSKGQDLVQIHVTGKVVDNTSKGISQKKLDKMAGRISKQVQKSYSGKNKNVEFETTTDITASSAGNPVEKSDHVFKVVDDVGAATTGTASGASNPGKAKPFEYAIFLRPEASVRTVAHELGHSMGLAHIRSATDLNFKFLTTNDYFGNLMHQSIDVNSSGQSVAGTKIEGFQIRKIVNFNNLGMYKKYGKQTW